MIYNVTGNNPVFWKVPNLGQTPFQKSWVIFESQYILSGKLPELWKITMLNGQFNYNLPFSIGESLPEGQ